MTTHFTTSPTDSGAPYAANAIRGWPRLPAVGVDDDVILSPAFYKRFAIPAISANRSYTIQYSGVGGDIPMAGDSVAFSMDAAVAFEVVIHAPGGVAQGIFGLSGSSGTANRCCLFYTGSIWVITDVGFVP
jgi:hypothetical protein